MISFRNFSYAYPSGRGIRVRILDIEGGLTVVHGPSGSGKSTFLKCINGLAPHYHGGTVSGSIRVMELDPVELGPRRMAKKVGFLFQDFEFQLVMDRVIDDGALGALVRGVDWDSAREAAAETLASLGIPHLAERDVSSLSGGEAQLVALAGILAADPEVVLLDEPLSQLDRESRRRILGILRRLREEKTVIVSEHRAFEALDPDLSLRADNGTLEEGPLPAPRELPKREPSKPGARILEIEDVRFSYDGEEVLRGATLEVREGEVVAIEGPNGAGKTTLLKVGAGILRPEEGRVSLLGKDPFEMDVLERARILGFVFQDAPRLFFEDSAEAEISITSKALGLDIDPQYWIKRARIPSGSANPKDLSVGEQIRLAIASAVAHSPRILFLDEPSRGQDYRVKESLIRFLDSLASRGLGILVATHDEAFSRALADRVLRLEGGRLHEV